MVFNECLTNEWQTGKREELGGCDPVCYWKRRFTRSAVGKMKAIPEAMWLWAEALRLHGVNS